MGLLDRARGFVVDVMDGPSPLVKQSAVVFGVGLAVLFLLVIPGLEITESVSFWSSIGLVALATVLAVAMGGGRVSDGVVMIIPVVDILAMGLLRAGTGGSTSLFSSLIILPVVWLASGEGRRFVVFACLATSLALYTPMILGITSQADRSEWVRGIFTPIVFSIAAAIVNELSRQSRERIRSIRDLADEKEKMLQRTVEYAAQLQESEEKYRSADRMFRSVWGAVTEQSVIGTDTEGLIDAWNPGATKLLGLTPEEAEDKMHIFDFHVPEELEARAKELNYPPGATVLNPGFSALVENARLGGAEIREWTYVRHDGTAVPVRLSVTKRVDETGEAEGYLFVAARLS